MSTPSNPSPVPAGTEREHRIDIEQAVDQWLAVYGDEDYDARDELLAVIYAWQQEQAADARRSAAVVSIAGEAGYGDPTH